MEKEKMRAMADTDLEGLLVQVGDYDSFVRGELKCHVCGQVISSDNLAMVIPFKGNDELKLRYICNNIDCVTKR